MHDLYIPRANSHKQFPFLSLFQRICASPKFVKCLVTQYSVTVLSCYHLVQPSSWRTPIVACPLLLTPWPLNSLTGRHLLHRRSMWVHHILLTWTHLPRLMIHSHYHHNYYHHYHHLLFSVAVSQLRKLFIPQLITNSILKPYSHCQFFLNFSLLISTYRLSVYYLFLTDNPADFLKNSQSRSTEEAMCWTVQGFEFR